MSCEEKICPLRKKHVLSGKKHLLSGKRLAIFGLHTFNLDKISEYEKTGKSDSFIVPVIGGTPTFFLLHTQLIFFKSER